MANKQAASNLSFCADLCKQARYHVDFLQVVDAVPKLKDPNVLRRAVYRYEKYWLPLASEHLGKCLAAPIDVEWVWHCHLLSPVSYEKDCQTIVGSTVNHMYRSQEEFNKSQIESKGYWNEKYPDEQFHLDFTEEWGGQQMEQLNSKLSYDIVEAAKRQADFVHKVSTPLHRNEKFLENSLLRYKQFIYLETNMPELQMVPANDIDLMWHTHQSNPLIYKDDMVRITGTLLDHDDTDTDQSEGSTLNNFAEETKDVWSEFYNEPLLLNIPKILANNKFDVQLETKTTNMGTCYNRCTVGKAKPDSKKEEMGTCYNRCTVGTGKPDSAKDEMGTCYNRCTVHKAKPDSEIKEMGTCYNRCTVNKAKPDSEMGTCYNRCTIGKAKPDSEIKEMGTCYNRCTVRKAKPDSGIKEMGTCYNRCTVRKAKPDSEIKEMGTCYNRCTVGKAKPDSEIKEMGTCYNRCTVGKAKPDSEIKEMGTCYNRCTVRKTKPDSEEKEMGTCYNRCTVGKAKPDSEIKEMGTCYNRCTVGKAKPDSEIKEMGTCYNRCTVGKAEPDSEMGTCFNGCTVRKATPDSETKEIWTCFNRSIACF